MYFGKLESGETLGQARKQYHKGLGTLGNTANFRIYSHDDCLLHLEHITENKEWQLDQPQRITSILNRLGAIFTKELFATGRQCGKDDLVLFHVEKYYHLLEDADVDILSEAAAKRGGKLVINIGGKNGDSRIAKGSLQAARSAAGSAIHAVQAGIVSLENGTFNYTAFCAIRSPGHHAFTYGTHGMCIYNNVGICAKYLVNKGYRVVVFDFDTHHGDGLTQGLRGEKYIFIGGTFEEDMAPALEKDPTHDAKLMKNKRISLKPLGWQASSDEFNYCWEEIMKSADQFVSSSSSSKNGEDERPIFVLVAAGFDGHAQDGVGQCKLKVDDYGIVTRRILKFCESVGAPCVSVLEGGYNCDVLPICVEAHCRELHYFSMHGHIREEVLPSNYTPPHSRPKKKMQTQKQIADAKKALAKKKAQAAAAKKGAKGKGSKKSPKKGGKGQSESETEKSDNDGGKGNDLDFLPSKHSDPFEAASAASPKSKKSTRTKKSKKRGKNKGSKKKKVIPLTPEEIAAQEEAAALAKQEQDANDSKLHDEKYIVFKSEWFTKHRAVKTTDTLSTALKKMCEYRCTKVFIIDENEGTLHGSVSLVDLCRRALENESNTRTTELSQYRLRRAVDVVVRNER